MFLDFRDHSFDSSDVLAFIFQPILGRQPNFQNNQKSTLFLAARRNTLCILMLWMGCGNIDPVLGIFVSIIVKDAHPTVQAEAEFGFFPTG